MKFHLSPQVKKLFIELKEASNSHCILSGVKANMPLTENTIPRAIKLMENCLGLLSWTAHDLRRTFAAQLGEILYIDPVVIEKCLGIKCHALWQRIARRNVATTQRSLRAVGVICRRIITRESDPVSIKNVCRANMNRLLINIPYFLRLFFIIICLIIIQKTIGDYYESSLRVSWCKLRK